MIEIVVVIGIALVFLSLTVLPIFLVDRKLEKEKTKHKNKIVWDLEDARSKPDIYFKLEVDGIPYHSPISQSFEPMISNGLVWKSIDLARNEVENSFKRGYFKLPGNQYIGAAKVRQVHFIEVKND